MLRGIPVSEGIGIAPAHWLRRALPSEQAEHLEHGELAIEQFHRLVDQVKKDIEQLLSRKGDTGGSSFEGIFEAHLALLDDPMFAARIEEKIGSGLTVVKAVRETEKELTDLFINLDDSYLRERAADIKDICQRILLKLNPHTDDLAERGSESGYILVAGEITPSDVLEFNASNVKGILTSAGGATAHAAIIARSLGIPAVSGIAEEALHSIQEGVTLVVDAVQGQVWVNPEATLIQEYQDKASGRVRQRVKLGRYRDQTAVTRDGKRVEVGINIGNPEETEDIQKMGADGIGLFRTELFYANREDWPSEEEQYQAYKNVLEKAQGKPVIVRTLDIGGDKGLSYLKLKQEDNPFLGLRAIRLCLKKPEILRTQLRALLRASMFGQLRIMFPMISGWQELAQAKALLDETKEDLRAEGYEISREIQVGIMIEIPSAAIQAEILAKEADFFSIGTNDLVQYTLAVDRLNEQVSYLYDYFHPAVLHLLKAVAEAAHKEGKWVGMCGEMAGDPLAVPLLLALGLDELSMSSQRILEVKKIITESDSSNPAIWQEISKARTADDVRRILRQF